MKNDDITTTPMKSTTTGQVHNNAVPLDKGLSDTLTGKTPAHMQGKYKTFEKAFAFMPVPNMISTWDLKDRETKQIVCRISKCDETKDFKVIDGHGAGVDGDVARTRGELADRTYNDWVEWSIKQHNSND